MFHLAAFTGNIANVANTNVPALTDSILAVQSNGFLLPQNMLLLGSAAMAAHLVRSYLTSPKLVQTNPMYIRPVTGAVQPPSVPPVSWHGPQFPRLNGQETLLNYATGTNGTNEVATTLIWLADTYTPIPAGEVYKIYATSTTAAVANAWTLASYTLVNALPAGTYTMVGSLVTSTNAIAHRWTYDNQFWRAGHLSYAAETNQPSRFQNYYEFGSMGTFNAYSLPRLELLVNGTDAAHNVYMEVVKVG